MTEDRALMARAVRGEADAFSALAAAHRPTVVRIARHLLGDSELAEDVAQDVFVRLQGALPDFRGEAALDTWLYRVTLNQCRDQLRVRRRRRRDVDADSADAPALSFVPHPEHDLDLERARQAVRAAIGRLPSAQREAVVLRFLEERSYAEIARLTGTPQGTVATRVFRALERLGRDLEPRHLEVVQ